ncbi:family 25 glycoside hydrolase [Russula earlei]|uniref:Family 25 glycoside hydrolase n=1 Tax=Russula earlei TaxID=71964 RepID=A0ACC0U4X5_9AGAM|nr:family 25 glycoside hydrolase [Russula earlei]
MKLGFNAVLEIADYIGIDVYHNNGNINWTAVKADPKKVKFVYVKATEGATVQDALYAANIQGATAAGFATGAYHFFSLTTSAADQAANFIQQVGDTYPYEMPPVLDYEKDVSHSDVPNVIAAVSAWLAAVQSKWGVVPMIYTSVNYWSQLGNPPGFDQYPLWLANYNKGLPALPGDWPAWAIWQYSGSGVVSGITGDVDLNQYNVASGFL